MSLWNDSLALDSFRPNHFKAQISDAWNAGTHTNGGYLAAIGIKAMAAVSPFPDAIATSSFFLSAAQVGEADLHITELRIGRSTASYSVDISQGKLRTRVTATFADLSKSPGGIQFAGELPPDILPISECKKAPSALDNGTPLRLNKHVEMFIDERSHASKREMTETAWWRFADGTEPDGFSAVLAVDSFVPVVFKLGLGTWCPTLELTTHLRAIPAPGWLRVHRKTNLLNHGYFEEDASVWDSNDVLVMQSHQLARMG